jgi:hypothetical protein
LRFGSRQSVRLQRIDFFLERCPVVLRRSAGYALLDRLELFSRGGFLLLGFSRIFFRGSLFGDQCVNFLLERNGLRKFLTGEFLNLLFGSSLLLSFFFGKLFVLFILVLGAEGGNVFVVQRSMHSIDLVPKLNKRSIFSEYPHSAQAPMEPTGQTPEA